LERRMRVRLLAWRKLAQLLRDLLRRDLVEPLLAEAVAVEEPRVVLQGPRLQLRLLRLEEALEGALVRRRTGRRVAPELLLGEEVLRTLARVRELDDPDIAELHALAVRAVR